MEYNSDNRLEKIRYRNIECSKMSDKEISETAKMFSDNYGVWANDNPNETLRGKKVKFTDNKIKEFFVNKPDRYVTLAYIDDELVGHIFYLRRNHLQNKPIIWVLQLVVSKKYRNNRIATKMLHSIWGLSNCYAWGLYTSNPMTIRALEKATMRRVNVDLINKNIECLKKVAYDIFSNMDWINSYYDGIVNTEFYVDHSDLSERIKNYGESKFSMNVNLRSGEEWLAFTFSEQKPEISDYGELEDYLDFSEDILKQAYSNMNMINQGWASHTKDEIDYIIRKKYIGQDDSVIDIGCGCGRHTIELNKRGITTLGIDFSESNIQKAKEISGEEYFECEDIRSYITDSRYNVALCLYDVVGSFPDERDNYKVLKSINKLLQTDGKIILSVMNMTLTRRICKNIVNDIESNIDKLLKLSGTNTMQSTGNVFNGKHLMLDDKSGIVYRKEQFFSEDALPCEYVVRDRRYTLIGIQHLLSKAGFIVEDSFYFKAGRLNRRLDENSINAKEIFVVGRKAKACQRLALKLSKIPEAWK